MTVPFFLDGGGVPGVLLGVNLAGLSVLVGVLLPSLFLLLSGDLESDLS